MEGALFLWLIAFFLLVALLIMVVYQLMCLADLEFDYINPYDSASRINCVVLPEYVLLGVLGLLFLLTGHWLMFLFSAPAIYYNVKLVKGFTYITAIVVKIYSSFCMWIPSILQSRYQQRQHLIDVTEIFNLLNREKKRRLFKLIYFVFLLFLSLFWMIWSVMEDDD